MSKHTPGPWKFTGGYAPAVKTQTGHHICGGILGIPDQIGGYSLAECSANARLIAAAPDLLAALKDWQELRDSEGDDGRDVVEWIERVERQMRAAIAKAEGVQQ